MRKSVKVRVLIFNILSEIHQKNKNFDESFIGLTQNLILNDQDTSMVYNIVLNSIRNNFFINEILNQFLQKKTSLKIRSSSFLSQGYVDKGLFRKGTSIRNFRRVYR